MIRTGATKPILLIAYSILILVPLATALLTSFKKMNDVYAGALALPKTWVFSNFTLLLFEKSLLRYFLNSVTVTAASVFFALFFASMIAYGITRLKYKQAGILFGVFMLGMVVPAQTMMVPLYSFMLKMHLTNSLAGLILVHIAVLLPICVFILTGFMRTLPEELFEAARVDGATEWSMYRSIAIPLSLPSIAITAIFSMVIVWNDLLFSLLFITNEEKKTLPLALLQFQGEYLTNYPVLFAGVLITSLPLILLYVFLQRFFISGALSGAVKG
ncbi:carbohydrate ABC transporter permease [Metabacillus sp. GX 13764]|uniref:carbohydrate ABC transporter permease n=1 Tax=Metabacillus kandeliae TaxID=2900151 RepID=UPI001E3AACD4|nr:carbohydrate ABC transporter permease [Metabacillus kandeliae]MCD7034632.1 carbohydrate ABC transporter permease [Metabacillus kandeliae]